MRVAVNVKKVVAAKPDKKEMDYVIHPYHGLSESDRVKRHRERRKRGVVGMCNYHIYENDILVLQELGLLDEKRVFKADEVEDAVRRVFLIGLASARSDPS